MNPIEQPWAKYSSDELNAATSNTYGKGIDPSSVPELLAVVEKLLEVMAGRSITFTPLKPVIEAASAVLAKSIIKQ
jgi:hypothetical protein